MAEKFKMKNLSDVNKIYKNSFPKIERESLFLLILNVYLKKAEIFCLYDDDVLCGFTYLFNYKNLVFIFYLAIDSNKRSKGYGSYLLKWCLNEKKDKKVYLNIDELDEKFSDYGTRLKRLYFYLLNGLYLTDYLSVEEECNFNILSANKDFSVDEYIKLDKVITTRLLDKKSKIEKNSNENFYKLKEKVCKNQM